MRYRISLSVMTLVCGTALLTGCLHQTVKSAAPQPPASVQPPIALAASVSSSVQKSAQTSIQKTSPSSSPPNLPHHTSQIPGQIPTAAPTSPVDLSPASATAIDQLSQQYVNYSSQAMGDSRSYGVILPPGYDQQPTRRYPVIFLLHGGHGDQTDWFNPDKGDALDSLKQLYKTDKLPPSIVITPDGNDKRGSSPYWDPQYIDGPNGKVATALGDELVKLIQSRYRTLPAPNFWAIGGLSSGGWGAVNVGLHHPDHFSILFSHSGYFEDRSGPLNSPMAYIKTLPRAIQQRLSIYLDTGSSDGEYVQQAEAFHQELNRLQIKNLLQTFPGVHSWNYWRQHLNDSLTYVGNQFRTSGQS